MSEGTSVTTSSTTSTKKKFPWWAILLIILLVLALMGGLIYLIYWATSQGGSTSSSSPGLPTPSSWVNKNFKWQVVPAVSTNFVKSDSTTPSIGVDDINANWTLITPNTAVLLLNPGSFIVQNVTNGVNLSCDALGNLSMVTTSGTSESWIITVSGTDGYKFRSFSNRFLVASGNVLTASATTSDAATIFKFTQVVF